MRPIFKKNIVTATVIALGVSSFFTTTKAATIDEIKQKINDRTTEIQQLEQEISKYQTEITKVGQVAGTLKGEINRLDITRNSLVTDIKLTTNKVAATNLTIQKLNIEIQNLEEKIGTSRQGIAETLRTVKMAEEDTPLETLLSGVSLAESWKQLESLDAVSSSVNQRIISFRQYQDDLQGKRSEKTGEKTKLVDLQSNLEDQKKLTEANKKAKDALLKETKNTEANYQKLLKEKQARKQQVEAEVQAAEAELRTIIDPNSLPKTGTGALAWPLDKIIITQYFGNTAFATQNSQIYNGKGHNGIDLGAKTGTPVKAPRGGIVRGTGNTDLTCQGASYGQWILIDHDNGLSTLYGHLSLIKVSQGQTVKTGDLIAYSGSTGYTTGPHLHFTVVATAGVQIGSLKSKVAGCGTYRLPMASFNSYLNPLSYLPKL